MNLGLHFRLLVPVVDGAVAEILQLWSENLVALALPNDVVKNGGLEYVILANGAPVLFAKRHTVKFLLELIF